MKKKILSFTLALVMVLTLVPIMPGALAASTFSGGTGTEDDPYIITTAAQLAALAEFVNTRAIDEENRIEDGPGVSGDMIVYGAKSYKLGNDIDLSAYGQNWNGSKGWIPIGEWNDGNGGTFMGTFDGNGKKITGLYVNNPSLGRTGLFGGIGDGGTVKNLGVVDVNITGGGHVGGVSGIVGDYSTVINCYSTGNVAGIDRGGLGDGYRIGGVVGWLTGDDALVSKCYSTAAVNGLGQVGGIVGFAFSGTTVKDCYATGAVSGEGGVGGIVGVLSYSEMTNCAALNTSVKATGRSVGRVAGDYLESTMSGNRAWSGMTTDGGTAFSAVRGHDTINGATTHSNDPADRNGELPEKEPEPVEAPNLGTAASWARTGIQEAFDKGFVPTDIQDNYKNVITRQEFCRMAVKWLEYRYGKDIDAIVAEHGIADRMNHTFSDTTDPNILAAYRLGVTAGSVGPTDDTPGRFNPDGQFTRQEAATMIMNTCKVAGFDAAGAPAADFADMDKAASWARPGVNFVRANGIMSGDGTNFNPTQTYSREQSIITFNNIK